MLGYLLSLFELNVMACGAAYGDCFWEIIMEQDVANSLGCSFLRAFFDVYQPVLTEGDVLKKNVHTFWWFLFNMNRENLSSTGWRR